ncbi:peptidoglycan L-alanyl-D-glutamate endopeptidase CwlK [Oceanospirillum multiglobuliferum]|uniref:Peptidase M15C domain-containing protein n=1 Tax=Oceanospirillum multiglobuliferum TaxID=64969 RepID=A0A1T4QYK1_9GAMM|nr:hypothetical protein [Oceanospirillum multiglobuliferum]OPX57056.1 hypothetical protein BTE48_01095 [Oceanospirillum multiglobuliferum]SKA08824.1 peptidoglycan L-alanyl-D-glutamate endopeptidase CwlK [Oceanospirillum multiglobuliferum]
MSQGNGYVLGARSKQRLLSCHPDLVEVVDLAIQLTTTDFTVLETTRSPSHQQLRVSQGKSKTLNSRHLPKIPKANPTLGAVAHAVDLGAWVNGTVAWDWMHYFVIADAIKTAAEFLKVPIRWGGCWDYLDHYDNAEQAYHAYLRRKQKAGETPFTDGPHFELCWKAYPV